MGCGSSISRDVLSLSHCRVNDNTKNVHVEKCNNAKLRVDDNIVFVFGGPGSGKGKIISELLEEQSCGVAKLISTELLILDQLPHKVSNAIKLNSTKDVTDLLQTDPSHVSLQWILSLVEQHIRHHDNNENTLYLVDLLPNLQCMVTNSNIGQDCHTHLAQFEAKLPISFALYLAVSEKDVHTSHYNGLQPQGATIGDEADNSRTKQRFLSYQKLATPFLQYFKDNGCLVTVDVSSGETSCVQKVINNLFISDSIMSPCQPNNAVLVFALNGIVAGNLDLSQIAMATTVTLGPLVTTANSLEDELRILLDQLQNIGGGAEYIVINTEQTTLANQNANQFSKQAVMFNDVTPTNHSTPCQKLNDIAMTTYFKSFYSRGKTLLFPVATCDHFCEIVSCYLSNN